MKHTPQNPFGPQVVHGDLRRTLVRYFDRSQNMNYFAYTEEQR